MAQAEEPLPGNVGGAVRVGSTVHRPTGPWTPAVHELLRYLHPRLRCVPRVHGFDDHGRETLEYMKGTVIDFKTASLTDGQLASLSRWTREFHEVVAGFEHAGPWRYFPVPGAHSLGHNDLGPYNVCFDGDELAGVFDWDMAGPTHPLAELALVAWTSVPLAVPVEPLEVARRLEIVADAYGGPSALSILRATPARIQLVIEGIPRAAHSGDSGMQNLVRLDVPRRCGEELAALVAVMAEVEEHLSLASSTYAPLPDSRRADPDRASRRSAER